MVILRNILIFIIASTYHSRVWSADIALEKVEVRCEAVEACANFNDKFDELKGKHSIEDLRNKIKFLSIDSTVESMSYKIVKKNEDSILSIEIKTKPIIKSISFQSNLDFEFDNIKNFLPYSVDGSYDYHKNAEAIFTIRKFLADRGYRGIKTEIKVEQGNDGVAVTFNVNVDYTLHVKEVRVDGVVEEEKIKVQRRFSPLLSQPWDKVKFKVLVDQMRESLYEKGFLYSTIDGTYEINKDKTVTVIIKVNYGYRYNFYFSGNNTYSFQELLEKLKASINKSYFSIKEDEISKIVNEAYIDAGLYDNEIKVKSTTGKTKFGISYINYYVDVKEGSKLKIKSLILSGNIFLQDQFIYDLYYENASTLASRGFLDKKYLTSFINILKKEYLARGFVQVNIREPTITGDANGLEVSYKISEKQQATLSKVNIQGVPEKLANEIKRELVNKEGNPLNVIEIQDDVNKAINLIRNKGYYFANVLSSGDEEFVSYSSGYDQAEIKITFDLGKRTVFNNVYVTGNERTKKSVILREVKISKGEALNPQILNRINSNLLNLGLFASVKLNPMPVATSVEQSNQEDMPVNLFIKVEEKDFGVGEIAPGYRTDIGVKLSTSIAYNNLFGKNHSISTQVQANQRFNFSNLDARRRAAQKRMIEYFVKTNYSWPYFLMDKLSFDVSTSFRRRRFYSFDADIYRISPQVSKQFNNFFATSIRYQYEMIKQFDATSEKDSNRFRIGGLTPSVVFDFRDSAVNTRKGAYFALSYEFANPTLLSMKTADSEVNFYKLVSRNRLYFPYKNFVLALAANMGVEKNLARDARIDANGNVEYQDSEHVKTRGFIPSIKVFRLDGVDTIRGFSDDEINRLESGKDISEIRIQDTAYFASLKIEPRYYMTDSTAMGLFLDAGRLYVNHFQPVILRTASGVSFKFVTPVGSLDLDYGMKLHRKRHGETREDFGRLHISIGYF